ncbi:NAD-dependent protein deacetylase sirtuin-2 [Podochytrium sp. JEL0797]|nr:NAD-dependent protein deacetylase sirtuin-2 [Podochytrium sp. JEL0797]
MDNEAGFAIYPKTDCPHVKNGIKRLSAKELAVVVGTATTNACQDSDCKTKTAENWMCLDCQFVGCSRYIESHLLDHHSTTKHPIAISFADISVFCYLCEEYILAKEAIPVLDAVHFGKFGERHPSATQLPPPSHASSSSSADAPLVLFDEKDLEEVNAEKELKVDDEKVPAPKEAARVLKDSSIESFAEYIRENKCKKIVVLTGAGLSTSAGIPDFRSAGTGLYSNLEKYNLPSPEAIFEINYFRNNPKPFFVLAKELYPGNFQPSLGHYFIRLLGDKQILLRNWTQNIDTLERVANIPADFLVEAHGSFGAATCVGHYAAPTDPDSPYRAFIKSCGRTFTQDWVKERVFADEIPRCPTCDGLVKPNITFFGESLPSRFNELMDDFETADAVIVMGSSLTVSPFRMLPEFVGKSVPRLLINKEVVGNFDFEKGDEDDGEGEGEGAGYGLVGAGRDALFLGTCDEGCERLAELLGWGQELKTLVAKETDLLKALNKMDSVKVEEPEGGDEEKELAELLEKTVL